MTRTSHLARLKTTLYHEFPRATAGLDHPHFGQTMSRYDVKQGNLMHRFPLSSQTVSLARRFDFGKPRNVHDRGNAP